MLSAATSLRQWQHAQQEERRRIINQINDAITIPKVNRICDTYPMRTLRLIEHVHSPEFANALYAWTKGSYAYHKQDKVRQLILFGVPYAQQVGTQMLLFAIDQTIEAHPRFHQLFLSEMNEEDIATFTNVLSVLMAVYLARREARWVPLENDDWNRSLIPCWEEAEKAFPRASKDLIEIITDHTDRSEDIVRCLIDRGISISNADPSGIIEYLESDSRVLAEGSL